MSLPWAHSAEHRSPRFARWGELLWRRPLLFGGLGLLVLFALALPVLGARTGMPAIKVVPPGDHSRVGYEQLSAAFGPGAPGVLQVTAPRDEARQVAAELQADQGVAIALPPQAGRGGVALIEAMPVAAPSSIAFGATLERLRAELPAAAQVGGTAAENHDLEAALEAKTPLVIGVVLGLGFLLLLVAFQAPLIAALGVLTNRSRPPPPSASPSSSSRTATSPARSASNRRASSTPGPRSSSSPWSSRSRWTTPSSCSPPPASTGSGPATPARRWSAASPTPAASSSPPAR